MLRKSFNLISAVAILFLSALLLWANNRGFDISDEGYYLYLYASAKDHSFAISSFHLLQQFLFPFFPADISILRIERLVLSLLASGFLSYAAYVSFKTFNQVSLSKLPLFSFVFGGFCLTYSLGPQTPAYNFFSLFFLTLTVSILILDTSSSMKSASAFISYLIIGCSLAALFLVKFPNTFFVLLVIPLFLYAGKKFRTISILSMLIRFSGVLIGYMLFMILLWKGVGKAIDFHFDLYDLIVSNNSHHEGTTLIQTYADSLLQVLKWPFQFKTILIFASLFLLFSYSRKIAVTIACTLTLLIVVIYQHYYFGGGSAVELQVQWLFMVILAVMSYLIYHSIKNGERVVTVDSQLMRIKWLLFSMPFIASIGSSNSLTIQLIYYVPFWLLLIYLMFCDSRLAGKPVTFMSMILVLGLCITQTTYAVIINPYRVKAPLRLQQFALPGKKNMLIDESFRASLNQIDSLVKTNGFQAGDYVFVYSEHIGLAYLLDGVIPGNHSYWYDHRIQSVNAEILRQFLQDHPTCRIFFIVNKAYPFTGEMEAMLEQQNCNFQSAYKLAGECTLPTNEGTDSLQIFVPVKL